jgi:hypothetical protein
MAGPFFGSDFGNPEVGWLILFDNSNPEFSHFNNRVHRVTETFRDADYNVFYTEVIDTSYYGHDVDMDFITAYEYDMNHYGQGGSLWKSSFGNPVIGQYIYYLDQLTRVSFVGEYTIELEEVNENHRVVHNEIDHHNINHQGQEFIF